MWVNALPVASSPWILKLCLAKSMP
ncbi:hypothetical protein [Photobacterium japonica]